MRHILTVALAGSLILATTACGDDEETAEETAEVPETANPPGEEAAEDTAEAEEAAEETAEAEPAAAGEGGHCAQAYTEISDMRAQLEEQLGESESEMVSEADFLEACGSLPENVQQCMVMSYGMQHQQECQEARNSVDDETKARIAEMMGQNR